MSEQVESLEYATPTQKQRRAPAYVLFVCALILCAIAAQLTFMTTALLLGLRNKTDTGTPPPLEAAEIIAFVISALVVLAMLTGAVVLFRIGVRWLQKTMV